MRPVAVTITDAVATKIEQFVGQKAAGAALAAMFRGIEDAGAPGSTRAVSAEGMLSCFVTVPLAEGAHMTLRAYWCVDATTGRKVIVKLTATAS